MIPIFVEPSYSGSIWCQNMLKGLESGLKYKRISYQYISKLKEITGNCEYMYVIGSATEWIQAVLEACNRMDIHPILLSNQSDQRFLAEYSAVCSDTALSMKCLVNTLREIGKNRIALYGINPDSVSDNSRQLCFQQAMHTQAREHLFLNKGSLENCFRDFLHKSSAYDAVICANDFAAISLVRHLHEEAAEELDRLTIIGCAQTRLTAFYDKHIQSVQIHFQDYGTAAVSLLETLRRNPFLSRIVMTVNWDFLPADKSKEEKIFIVPAAADVPGAEDRFYQDRELNDMLCIERILNDADELDKKIMDLLISGAANEIIAEQCYANISTIKYRVRKMIAAARIKNKQELIQLLTKYIPSNR